MWNTAYLNAKFLAGKMADDWLSSPNSLVSFFRKLRHWQEQKYQKIPCSRASVYVNAVIITSSYAFLCFNLPNNVISCILHHRRFAVRRRSVWYPGYTSGNTSLRKDFWDRLAGSGKISKWRHNSIIQCFTVNQLVYQLLSSSWKSYS